MAKCPNCGKELNIDDYDTYYNGNDTVYCVLCSDCGYSDYEEESEE